jgi:hypothetical protein
MASPQRRPYGHQDVWVRGYIDKVVIGSRGEIIARHPRSWQREGVVFDPAALA